MEAIVSTATQAPLIIGATGIDEISQNIRVILETMAYSCPLDRAFAGPASYLDSPLPRATAERVTEIIERVETYEPRVQVLSVSFEPKPDDALEGRLYPIVRFATKESA